MFGGPFGAFFGAAAASVLSKTMSKGLPNLFRWLGAIVGTASGFAWNQSGKNSLDDNAKLNLPGFMCLLPKDKLERYLKALFHMDAWGGKNHARLPYNYLSQGVEYPDKLSSTLGKSEISFTFTLTDNMMISRYNSDTGAYMGTHRHRTWEIGQDKETGKYGKSAGYIPLIDEQARVLPGQY